MLLMRCWLHVITEAKRQNTEDLKKVMSELVPHVRFGNLDVQTLATKVSANVLTLTVPVCVKRSSFSPQRRVSCRA